MKVITISIELVVDDDVCKVTNGIYNKGSIAEYLNNKLYTDPEFFGDFGQENIVEVREFD